MGVRGFGFAFLLVLTPLSAAKTSFLQQRRGRQGRGDWDETEVKLCTFAPKAGSDIAIKVFADESENTRYVSFARIGYVSDDGFIESMQKCKGEMPKSCKKDGSDCVACPCELDLKHEPYGNYQRRMIEFLSSRCHAQHASDDPFRVLLVGLGGGALVQYILDRCPRGTIVEAVEYDARMIEVASRFFGLHPESSVLKVEQGDGGKAVAARAANGQRYDMVLVDAFAGGSHVPESCKDAAFVRSLRKILKKGGAVLHNMAGPTVGNLAGPQDYKSALPLYKKIFGNASVKMEELLGNMEFPANLIVAQARA